MKKVEKSFYGLKNHYEAWQKADANTPITRESIERINAMHTNQLITRDDARFFVLMNYIRSIDAALNPSIDDTYLRRIQDNILLAGEMFLLPK